MWPSIAHLPVFFEYRPYKIIPGSPKKPFLVLKKKHHSWAAARKRCSLLIVDPASMLQEQATTKNVYFTIFLM